MSFENVSTHNFKKTKIEYFGLLKSNIFILFTGMLKKNIKYMINMNSIGVLYTIRNQLFEESIENKKINILIL